jgi:hypothetical protein
MKTFTTAVAVLLFAAVAFAGELNDDPGLRHKLPAQAARPTQQAHSAAAPGGLGNLRNHGGPVIPYGKVVYIFWGSSWSATDPMVTELQSFRDSFYGMVSHMGMLNQYNAPQNNLKGLQADVFDSANPSSAAVTDAMVQAEVQKWFAGRYDNSTVYEVFIPNGYYSQDGSDTSCGGPSVAYCAYHSNFVDGATGMNVKYSIEPYPSCSGCAGSGWTTTQNAEHFVVHETREALTDALGTAWYDLIGYEADDKCAWGTAGGLDQSFIFLENAADGHTYGYQMEYSNAVRNCVK